MLTAAVLIESLVQYSFKRLCYSLTSIKGISKININRKRKKGFYSDRQSLHDSSTWSRPSSPSSSSPHVVLHPKNNRSWLIPSGYQKRPQPLQVDVELSVISFVDGTLEYCSIYFILHVLLCVCVCVCE